VSDGEDGLVRITGSGVAAEADKGWAGAGLGGGFDGDGGEDGDEDLLDFLFPV